MKLKINELHASSNGMFVVGGTNTKEAFVWDIGKNELINKFKVSYTERGKRLAIDNSGRYVAAATYSGEGVALYCVETGEKVWTLKEIDQIQRMYFIEDKNILSVISNSCVEYFVNVIGGDIFGDMECEKVLDTNGDHRIIVRNKSNIIYKDILVNMDCICLAGIITPFGIAISKLGGGISFFDNKGENTWNQDNNKNEHIVKLAYEKHYNYICGLIYKYNSPRKEPFFKLACYNVNNGEVVYENDLDNGIDFVFVEDGNKILSTTGSIYSIEKNQINLLTNIRHRNRN